MKKNSIHIKFPGTLMFVVLLWSKTFASCGKKDDTKPLLDVSTTSVLLPAEGGTSNITVTSNDQWSVDNSAFSWLQLSQTSSGSGSTEIQLTADLNTTGSTRSTRVSV